MQVKKKLLEPDMEQQTGLNLGKEYIKAVYCHPAYLIYMQSTTCKKCQAERSTSWNQDFQEKYQQPQIGRWHHLYVRKWRRTKKPIEETEKKKKSEIVGLKLNIQKTEIMAFGPIISWQIDGETVETVTDFILWAQKSLQMMTLAMKLKDGCSLEEKLWQTWTMY